MIVVADSSAMFALLDTGDQNHRRVANAYEKHEAGWLIPSATLPEIDYLLSVRLGVASANDWFHDLTSGAFIIVWNEPHDLHAAWKLHRQYASLNLGLVDALVMATAERLHADAIATLDLRHFGAVRLAGGPRLLPRDG